MQLKNRETNKNVWYDTILDCLSDRAINKKDATAYIFLEEEKELALTYEQLDRKAKAIAAYLQSIAAKNERALLLYPPGLDFIAAFFGCLYAGAIAVPVYPPRGNKNLSRLLKIANDAEAKIALTTETVLNNKTKWDDTLNGMHWVATDKIATDWALTWQNTRINPDSLAFLQYTSGSTGNPKGVMVTHANLMHNSETICTAFDHNETTTVVGWLPLFHDMGLIGNVLQPMYLGRPSILMSPVAFLQKPLRWLQAISKYKASTSGGPSFAYDLCTRKIKSTEVAGLDLSSWRVAFNGAEPVRADVLEDFVKKFDRCGFRAKAFYPCYGMAESTLLISGGLVNSEPKIIQFESNFLAENLAVNFDKKDSKKTRLVGCGKSWLNHKIVIVNPEFCSECKEGEVGEIWVKGDSIAAGYWKKAEITRNIFDARSQDTGEKGFLRTGDLGFIKDGELFVTGRLKDLIIIRGRNYYPQDLEVVAENSHEALNLNSAAAFSCEIEGEERLLIAIEVKRTYLRKLNSAEVISSIRRAVSEEFQLQVYGVLLLKTSSIPKTSSGKIQRQATCQDFLSQNLNLVGSTLLDNLPEYKKKYLEGSKEERVKQLIAIALNINPLNLDLNSSLTSLGIDSLKAIELQNVLESDFGVSISMTELLDGLTVSQLLKIVSKSNKNFASIIKPVSRDNIIPLSFAAERLWFFEQLEAGKNCIYNEQFSWLIKGELNLVIFKIALLEILRRHEILRTGFTILNDRPIQKIDLETILNIRLEKLESIEELEKLERFKTIVEEEALKPFDLDRPPLIRFTVLKTNKNETIFLITVHHLICDGLSLNVFIKELSIIYSAFLKNKTYKLPELPIQYADFAVWQRNNLNIEEKLKYWKKQLKEIPSLLQLPTDRPRQAKQTYRGDNYTFIVSRKDRDRLQELSRKSETTTFMTLLAVFSCLLHRYSGQKDIIIGSPIANRNRQELQNLIGFFINTLALRNCFENEHKFSDILQQVKQTVLAAYQNQDVSFDRIVEAVKPPRYLSYNPIFQVLFNLINLGDTALKLPDLEIKNVPLNRSIARFDLTLYAKESTAGIEFNWVYNRDLFDRDTILKMSQQFENLLIQVLENPNCAIEELSLVTPRCTSLLPNPREALLEPNYPTLADIFRDVAELHSEKIAVSRGYFTWTYRELKESADRISRVIRKGEVVAVTGDSSFGLISSILGVVLAGGILLTLDRNLPEHRKALILQESKAKFILAVGNQIVNNGDIAVIYIDADTATVAGDNLQKFDRTTISSEDPAYIFFTSGTTGTPKGVLGVQKGLSHFLDWQRNTFDIKSGDRVAQLTGTSFDVILREIFLPLTSGATLCLPENRDNILDVINWLKEQRITVLHTVPSLGQFWLSNSVEDSLPDLRWLFFAGEPLSDNLVTKWRNILPDGEIVNLYGPTETTLAKFYYQIPSQISPGIQPVGFPLPHTQALVLNSRNNLCGIGEVGEIVIRTPFRSLGYINANLEQQKRFIKNPHTAIENDLLYFTGDRGRYSNNGSLQILGRIDRQVKIRGVRIELGEIESILSNHQEVKQAVVTVKDDLLIGYLVTKKDINLDRIRDYLKQRLPEYTIPSVLITIETLPLNPNGKVDRNALPTPVTNTKTFISPKNTTQKAIANIFATVLNLESVGIEDNFFALGGHSLLATQVISRLPTVARRRTP